MTAIDHPYDYSTLNLEEAAQAYSLFTIHQIFNNGDMRFSSSQSVVPGTRNDVEACTALYRSGFLRIGKETPLNAFASTDTEGEYKMFPDRVAWRFPMPSYTGEISDIGKALRNQLDRCGLEGTSSPDIKALWWSIAREEAYAHLGRLGAEYRLSIARGIALETAICSSLQKFSIPQVRSLIWRSVRDAAAQAQKAGVIRAQAINSIPGRLSRMSDRYAANKWDIGSYVMNWTEEEPVLITVFFDNILKTGVTGFRDITGAAFD